MELPHHPRFTLRRMVGAFALTLAILVASMSCASAASSDAQDARDAALVSTVKLDMDLVARLTKAGKQAHAALEKTCLLGHGPAADKDKGLAACGDTLGKVPSIKQALAANGLTGRQFALGYSALVAAIMGGQGVMENAKEGWDGVRELGVNPEHVRFYIAHHAEIDHLTDSTSH